MGNGTITMTGAEYDALAGKIATLEADNAKLRAELERRAVDDHTEQALAMVPVKPTQAMISAGWKVGLMGMDRDGPQAIYAAMLAAAPSAPKADDRPLYTCIGKGGEYRYLGTAIGAGDSRGELAEVYQDRTGQLFHRTPEDFMERMEPIAAARKGEGE